MALGGILASVNEPQTPNRRGFIKGIVAGLAGAFFALRGVEPVNAAAVRSFPITTVSLNTPEIVEKLSEADKDRLDYLMGVAEGGEGISEEEQNELSILEWESLRLGTRTQANEHYQAIKAYRTVRLRAGEFAYVVFPLRFNGIVSQNGNLYARYKDGTYPVLIGLEEVYAILVERLESMWYETYTPPR